ncbi:type II toxin-antitoxin system RelE/ParE family toxin [Erythrobacter sp. EC-HK427]|uniref:type II toxin-antitoxin system RelE/ParE family toxin n=1 Tax=Erythrobacter sp. EC-HK427 TaxID=2038396 RepID=UPI0012577F8B|nr:type II toxin-antitoxin system RelE/ParE family toxin [Erythrobacter sp. EC-HK427]VVT14114.1 Addiction module antitoxin [Erythrobacter sp. EC-HK427]
MKVIWRPNARDDLRTIIDYISDYDEAAAYRLRDRAFDFAERIAQFPYMFRSGRLPNTREAVLHPNYILIYRVSTDCIEIVGVIHSRQQYP